ncbi:hypothetical protein HpNP24_01520 [Helicobacter pylori]
MTKPPNGGVKRLGYLKNAKKSALTDYFLMILIEKTTPIKWFLSLKRNDLKNVFFLFSLNRDN